MKNFLKRFWAILLIGLILRILLASITFHPDVRSTALASGAVLQTKNFDFYGQSKCVAPNETLDDLPLSYLISLPVHFIERPLVNSQTEYAFLNHQNTLYGNPSLWLYLLYTKLPLIIFDLSVGVLLFFITKSKRVLIFWLFNPFTLWATIAIGQFDIYPTFFAVLSFLLLQKGRLNWAALALGIGGAIKSGPFLLLPFLLGTAKSWKERLLVLGLASVPYLLTVTPYLWSPSFRQDALFAPQLSKILFTSLPISGGAALLIVPTVLVFIYIYYLSKRRDLDDFLNFAIITLLMILSLTHFHLQWFLWVIPFLLIKFRGTREPGIILSLIGIKISLIGMLLLFDSSLSIKLFSPIIPSLDPMVGFAESLGPERVTFFRNIFASLFAGSNFYLIWKILK